MKKRLLCLLVFLFLTIGCSFVTGEKKTDPKTGETTYEQSPMVTLTTAIGGILGVSAIAVPAARIARNAMRTRNAIFESNKVAIDNADWKNINTAEAFKKVMKLSQDSHDDSILLRKEFNKWNGKRKNRALNA